MEEDTDEGQRSGEPTLFNSETATTAWGQTAHRTPEIYDAARVGRSHRSSNMTAFTLHCFPNNRTSTANRVGNSPAYTVAGYFLKTELSIRWSFFTYWSEPITNVFIVIFWFSCSFSTPNCFLLWEEMSRTGLSNIRLVGQNWPGRDSNPVHWTALKNVKEGIDFGLLTLFS